MRRYTSPSAGLEFRPALHSLVETPNNNTMKRLLSTTLTAVLLMVSVGAFAQKATDVIGQKTKPANLAKFTLPTTDVAAPKPDTRAALCCLNFDNWTGYTLYVWVDGNYKGTVSSWDEGRVCVGDGWTTYYVRTAGGTYEWEGSGNCYSAFNIRLEN